MRHHFALTAVLPSRVFGLIGVGVLFLGCGQAPVTPSAPIQSPSPQSIPISSMDSSTTSQLIYADVLSVKTVGQPSAYRFSVTIQSPDTGCDQYANWWEVISEEGELIHRRILLHSHVNEQPFSRSSGPVVINAEQSVIVRAHMHPTGYGGQALKGSVTEGFSVIELADDFAIGLAQQEPLPTGCSF